MTILPVRRPHAPPASALTLGYVRVSTEQQAGETRTSLEDQRVAIVQTAQRLTREVDHVFVDAGISGATAEARPAFMQLVTFCEAHPRRGSDRGLVLALNDSRWGRFTNPEEAGYWRVRLAKAGWAVRFAEGDELEDGVGRMVLRSIGAAQATEYRENLRRNASRGRTSAVQQGFWCGRPPFGYRRIVVVPAGRERLLDTGVRKADDERVKLTPGPVDEVATLRWLFQGIIDGTLTTGRAAVELQRRHPRPGGWPKQTVSSMLECRTYLGEVKTGRTVTPDAHPPLIDLPTFLAVQEILRARSRPRTVPHHVSSGLVSCSSCGAHYIGGGSGGRKPNGSRMRFYKCSRHDDSRHRCPTRGGLIATHKLDAALVAVVHDVVSMPAVQAAVAAAYDRAMAAPVVDTVAMRAEFTKRRREVIARRDRLVQAIAAGTLTAEEGESTLTALRDQIGLLDAELSGLRFEEKRLTPTSDERAHVLGMLADFRSVAATLEPPVLRSLLKAWIARAVFDKQTRRLTVAVRRIPEPTTVTSPRVGCGVTDSGD